MLYLLLKEESTFEKWQEEALENQQLVAVSGLNDIELSKDGKAIDKVEYGLEILNEIKVINNEDIISISHSNYQCYSDKKEDEWRTRL